MYETQTAYGLLKFPTLAAACTASTGTTIIALTRSGHPTGYYHAHAGRWHYYPLKTLKTA